MNRFRFTFLFALLIIPSTLSAGTWKFIVYGDTRSRDDIHRQVLQAMVANSPDYRFIINTGDLVDASESGRAILGATGSLADSVIINNCLFAHIKKRAVQFKDPKKSPGLVNYFSIENSTFWDIGEDGIYINDQDENVNTAGPLFYANRITVYDAGNYGAKCIYPKYLDFAVIKHAIIAMPENRQDIYPFRLYGPNSLAEYILYYNTSLSDNPDRSGP